MMVLPVTSYCNVRNFSACTEEKYRTSKSGQGFYDQVLTAINATFGVVEDGYVG
jgi:hypothetical protein